MIVPAVTEVWRRQPAHSNVWALLTATYANLSVAPRCAFRPTPPNRFAVRRLSVSWNRSLALRSSSSAAPVGDHAALLNQVEESSSLTLEGHLRHGFVDTARLTLEPVGPMGPVAGTSSGLSARGRQIGE